MQRAQAKKPAVSHSASSPDLSARNVAPSFAASIAAVEFSGTALQYWVSDKKSKSFQTSYLNFDGLVLVCMSSYDRSFFSIFRDLQSRLSGEKKVHALFFSRKKNTFGGDKGWQILRVKSARIEGG